jgi:hypothetical protein
MTTTTQTQPITMQDLFGPPIYAYTRAQALEDGFQVDISESAREAGYRYACYMTRSAWEATIGAGGHWVDAPAGDGEQELVLPHGQDVKGRTWDVLQVMLWRIRANRGPATCIEFAVSVYAYDGKHHRHNVALRAEVGPVDMDDARPAITIMLPNED